MAEQILPDRLPPIPADRQTAEQRTVSAELISGPRGALAGPFVPLLRSPGLMARVQKVGEFLRFESRLPEDVKELAILVVASHWSQGYEWMFHLPLALKAGVSRETAQAIGEGRRPAGMTPDQAAAHDFLTELQDGKGVGDAAYARALEAFGEAGVVDLTGFAGYYTLLAMVMNVARTPSDPAEIPLRPPEGAA
jgi:4-carboxymuconolactone decarboxylase